ncbi:hypothetical protein CYG49_02795 [Candidatus Saccharibacteria bacterium]|nr:MAG: hypothetical protein CYG49_02795 [Candidatus Saccharibacteria bacterium]
MHEIDLPVAVSLNDCDSVTTMMSELISRRRFRDALVIGQHHQCWHEDNHEDCEHLHFWFQMSLVNRLLVRDEDAHQCHLRAKQCPGYDQLIEGDFVRDYCLAMIRRGKLATAYELLLEARDLHGNDPNRMAALLMAEGRLKYAAQEYTAADELFVSANLAWYELGHRADRQWIANNRFHWLKATTLLDQRGISAYLYFQILESEKSWKRKLAAWLMYNLGKPGVKLVERFM